MTDARYPDFYCIGAQKSATTWLHSVLRAHPDVWMSPVKELHYFNQLHRPEDATWPATHRSRQARQVICAISSRSPDSFDLSIARLCADIALEEPTDAWYAAIFARARPDQVCGDIDPSYALIPSAGVRHMLALSPEARFVYVLRDPIDRAWSQIRMLVAEGRFSFTPPAYSLPTRPDIMLFSDYPTTIVTYRALLPAGQLMLVDYDAIRADGDRIARSVAQFIGLDPSRISRDAVNTRRNEGVPLEQPPMAYQRLREALEPVYDRLVEVAPEIGAKWRRAHYGR